MQTPVNIELLVVQDHDLPRLGRIKDQQIFGVGNNFHPEGLFSTEIFGAVGSEYRNRIFGYIDLNTQLLHPTVYKAIVSCKAFYQQILQGKATAIWNSKTKSFDKSTEPQAQTGYSFFLTHLKELKLDKNNSDKRNFNINLIEMALKQNTHLMSRLLVMPAGMRDYTVKPDGKPEEDEINSFYRRILTQSQLIDPNLIAKSPSLYDGVVYHVQNNLNELFDYIQSLLDGKNKLVLGKWLSRKIFNSTRNVLTASVDNTTKMNDPNRLRTNDTAIGLYQFLRVAAPKSLFHIKNTYLSRVFSQDSQFAQLTCVKTLTKQEVLSTHVQKDYDRWMTTDGLEGVIAGFGNLDSRHLPITLNAGKNFIGLLYNDGKYVKFLQDISELPEGFDKTSVSPITLAEFLYMSVYILSGGTPGFVTRYPINGYGGIYPCMVCLRTTTIVKDVYLLDEEWKPTQERLPSFPVRGEPFFNGMSVHQSHMGLLGADMDGDCVSLVGVQSDEACEEISKLLSTKAYYLDNEKRIIFSNSADIIDSVLSFLTTD